MSQQDDARNRLRSEIAAATDRVRHPELWLGAFVAPQYASAAELLEVSSDEDLVNGLPDGEGERARLRRGTMLVAAHRIIDQCLGDLARLRFDDTGLPDADDAEKSFVYGFFPPRHRSSYDKNFFHKVLVTAVKVAYDLADPDGGPAACTAEEIIRDTVIDMASDLCRMAGLGQMPGGLDELLLEDIDFEVLFGSDTDDPDDIANHPDLRPGLALAIGGAQDWFTAFRPDAVVHPYVETTLTEPAVHDLRSRLHGAQLDLADTDFDGPEPLAEAGPVSEVVIRARAVADRDDVDLWVSDDGDREKSFAALCALVRRSDDGGGWLTWQPHADADAVRTDPVTMTIPHRHFPVAPDEPWVDTVLAPNGRRLAIPLRAIASYRPDPEVRRERPRSPDCPPLPRF